MRKELVGKVISDKMEKTCVVEVERDYLHPLYKKIIRRFKKFYAHNPGNKAKKGDKVRIRETRPLSKLKRWIVVEKLEK